ANGHGRGVVLCRHDARAGRQLRERGGRLRVGSRQVAVGNVGGVVRDDVETHDTILPGLIVRLPAVGLPAPARRMVRPGMAMRATGVPVSEMAEIRDAAIAAGQNLPGGSGCRRQELPGEGRLLPSGAWLWGRVVERG